MTQGPFQTKWLGGQKMIYSKNDISKFYTNSLNTYLTEGYTVNITSMSGSQGEDAKIDLVKGDYVVRILADSEYVIGFGDIYKILVLSYKNTGSDLYWNNRGNILDEYYFIRTKDRRNYRIADEDEVAQIKLNR